MIQAKIILIPRSIFIQFPVSIQYVCDRPWQVIYQEFNNFCFALFFLLVSQSLQFYQQFHVFLNYNFCYLESLKTFSLSGAAYRRMQATIFVVITLLLIFITIFMRGFLFHQKTLTGLAQHSFWEFHGIPRSVLGDPQNSMQFVWESIEINQLATHQLVSHMFKSAGYIGQINQKHLAAL